MSPRPIGDLNDAVPDGALDEVTRRGMLGAHRHLVRCRGSVARYRSDVAPFMTLPAPATDRDCEDARPLCGPKTEMLVGDGDPPLGQWSVLAEMRFWLLISPVGFGQPEPQARILTVDDVDSMIELTRRTDPGPFGPRTIETGTYLGVYEDGRLIAMAGERWHVPGYTEISMVCTDPAYQGRGLAAPLTRAVGALLDGRGRRAFHHLQDHNPRAARLYERLGFAAHQLIVGRLLQSEGFDLDHEAPADDAVGRMGTSMRALSGMTEERDLLAQVRRG